MNGQTAYKVGTHAILTAIVCVWLSHTNVLLGQYGPWYRWTIMFLYPINHLSWEYNENYKYKHVDCMRVWTYTGPMFRILPKHALDQVLTVLFITKCKWGQSYNGLICNRPACIWIGDLQAIWVHIRQRPDHGLVHLAHQSLYVLIRKQGKSRHEAGKSEARN
jgi:hypothetical protein